MSDNKIYNISLLSLSLLTLFFLSANISYHFVFRGEMVSIPDLVGKTKAEAEEILAKKRLFLVQKSEQFHDHWPEGLIISQDPSSGSKIRVYKKVRVVLSSGSEKVTVPRLIGKNYQSVHVDLKASSLRKGKISQVHTVKYAAGKIIAQEPSAEEETGRNTPISLLVSRGEREKRYLMPDLIGKRATRVLAQLKEMDFRVEDLRYSYYPGLEPGIIIKQFPPQGFRIQKRNLITMEVSK